MQGLRLESARRALLALQHADRDGRKSQHEKNWRPQVLVLVPTGAPSVDGPYLPVTSVISGSEIAATAAEQLASRASEPFCVSRDGKRLLEFVSQMKEGRGLVVVSAILEGNIDDHTFVSAQKVRQAAEELQTKADESGIHGFAEVTVARNRFDGFCSVCQLSGLGSFKPNCVILAWPSSWKSVRDTRENGENEDAVNHVRMLQTMISLGKALIVCKGLRQFPKNTDRKGGTIDIWWLVHDGGMLLLLPHLLNKHKVWSRCKLRLFAVISAELAGRSAESTMSSAAREDEAFLMYKRKVVSYLSSLRIQVRLRHLRSAERWRAHRIVTLATNNISSRH